MTKICRLHSSIFSDSFLAAAGAAAADSDDDDGHDDDENEIDEDNDEDCQARRSKVEFTDVCRSPLSHSDTLKAENFSLSALLLPGARQVPLHPLRILAADGDSGDGRRSNQR